MRVDDDGRTDRYGGVLKPWADRSVRERLETVRDARQCIAATSDVFTAAISASLPRTAADTLAAEVLPLLAAMRFLERQAESILKPNRLSRRGLPIWLAGIASEVVRVPFGTVLVIGPSNYPLFLPGVQAVQAGNAVIWKPGRGGYAVAALFANTMYAAGVPAELLRVTDESIEAVDTAIASGVDKVFFTGSAAVGRSLLRRFAETLTPCVMELSGCDAVIVLPDADLSYVAKAVAFGMRLNGSATCMAPRRILLVHASPERRQEFVALLLALFTQIEGIGLPESVREQLASLLADAQKRGATVYGEADAPLLQPLLVADGTPDMQVAQADIFAPIVTLMEAEDEADILTVQEACPFGLTASIFGDEQTARRLAEKLVVGTVHLNDLIVATADPRVPFGGRRQSGFGTTRGAEGLLEMTAAKTIAVRRGGGTRRFDATGKPHQLLFQTLIRILYGRGWRKRARAMRDFVEVGKQMRKP